MSDAVRQVLAEYRRERRHARPFMALDRVMNDAAFAVALAAELGYTGAPGDVERFAVARRLRGSVLERKGRQAEIRGIERYESFWHHGEVLSCSTPGSGGAS